VNGGRPFTANPCLVEELRWAKRLAQAPAFYANTSNPGPWRTTHWPNGQTAPMACSWSDPNSLGCSFDYGWNAAHHSFELATTAAQRLHKVSWSNARHRAANVHWWLDVEIQLTKGPHEADAAVAFDPDLRPGTRSAEPVDIGQAVFVEYGARLAAPVPRSAASSNNLRWCGSSA